MSDVLGAVIAGGRSSRYGSPKALAVVGGARVVDRVIEAMVAAVGDTVAIVNDSALGDAIGLPYRGDVLGDAGALAGVHAALLWARERGCRGAVVAGCDMPFVSAALLAELVLQSTNADVVVPESHGPRGIEPLCAYYGVTCITPIEDTVANADARMIGFHAAVNVTRIPLARVRELGDPALLFRNLNTPDDRALAETLLSESSG